MSAERVIPSAGSFSPRLLAAAIRAWGKCSVCCADRCKPFLDVVGLSREVSLDGAGFIVAHAVCGLTVYSVGTEKMPHGMGSRVGHYYNLEARTTTPETNNKLESLNLHLTSKPALNDRSNFNLTSPKPSLSGSPAPAFPVGGAAVSGRGPVDVQLEGAR